MLRCPICKQKLIKKERFYTCAAHHCYDIAKQGYVNLLCNNHTGSGDDQAMIHARSNFLSHGYYQPLCDAIIQLIQQHPSTNILDAGCGEGFYTNQFGQAFPNDHIFGFDLSKSGIASASKNRQANTTYAVANVFHLPVMDHSSDIALSIFTPYRLSEMDRILKTHGLFICVGPGPQHLFELKQIVYPHVYKNQACPIQDKHWDIVQERLLTYSIDVYDQQDILSLFQMTPYYWKSPKDGCERLYARTSLTTTVEFYIVCYRKKAV